MDDYISREALVKELMARDFYPAIVRRAIESIPAADVRPVVQGAWVPHFEDYRGMMESNKCSVCGYEYYGTLYNFCPNCGAVMDGGSNNA